MLARIRKAQEEREGGFTLIELLVVMIIIGILAAIAIPVFLNQRKKAVDTSAKSDVSTIGKEVATYFVDNTTMPTVTLETTGTNAGQYTVAGAPVGRASKGVSAPVISGTATDWCVQVTVTDGSITNAKYSAKGGLATSAC